jgi:Vitamin B12 dependent methionine synthase, activation domain
MGATTCSGDLPWLSAISIRTAANVQYIDVGPDDTLCARGALRIDRGQGMNYAPGRHSGVGGVVCPANNRKCLSINRALTPIRSRYLAPLRGPGGATPLHTFRFGRQRRENGLCLSDYILEADDGRRDHIAMFVVSAGAWVRERSEEFKKAGEFVKAHGIQALGIETAEGAAEWLHRRIREDWGFPDSPTMTMQERFTSRYRGKRYSFGYPACPNLDDQQPLWMLLRPDEIGVHLTEGMMMEPEASVSALVFHHPDCPYFTADEGEAANS